MAGVVEPEPGAAADPTGELGTYMSLMSEAHMLGKTHVGSLRGGGELMKTRVVQMTDEVLRAARVVMKDLELLQEEYVNHYCRQRGVAPEFNGAWGTMHVFKALYQQLHEEVSGDMDKLEGAGRIPNLRNKRGAWNEKATGEWQSVLLGNEKSCVVERKRQVAALRKANAAASIIQNVWRTRANRLNQIRGQHAVMRQSAAKLLVTSAFATTLDRTKLTHREQNQKRRDAGMNIQEWNEVQTVYDASGQLDIINEDAELDVVPEDEVLNGGGGLLIDDRSDEEGGDPRRWRKGRGKAGAEGNGEGEGGKMDGDGAENDGEWEDGSDGEEGGDRSGDLDSDGNRRRGASEGQYRRFRRMRSTSTEASHLAARTGEAVDFERNTRSRIARRRYKQAFNANRLASLAAPKKVVDIEELRRKQANAPVWKAGGAAQAPGKKNAHSLMRRNLSSSSYGGASLNRTASNVMEIGEMESIAQFYDSLKVSSNSKWGALKTSMKDNGSLGRLSKLKGLKRATSHIHAPDSMKRRLQRALENFEEFGMSLDGWVKENKHVLQLIHEDAKKGGMSADKAAAAAVAQAEEADTDTARHKALIAQQVLVMSSMWGLMKKNLMDAQEAILHTDPAFQSNNYSMQEMRDGTAVVLRMWRDIGERVSPLQVALGNMSPSEVMSAVMTKTESQVKHEIANPHRGANNESGGEPIFGLLNMFHEKATESSADLLQKEKKHHVSKAKARYMEPRKEKIRIQQKMAEAAEARQDTQRTETIEEKPNLKAAANGPPPPSTATSPSSRPPLSPMPTPPASDPVWPSMPRSKVSSRRTDGGSSVDSGEATRAPPSSNGEPAHHLHSHAPTTHHDKSAPHLAVEARAEARQAREADRRAKEAGSGFMYFIAEAKTTTAEQTLRSGPSIVTMKTSRPLRGAPRSRQGTSDGSELSDSHHHPESPVSPEKTQPHARRGSVPPLRGSDFSSTSSRQNAFHLVAETPSSANDLGINSRRGVKSSNIANSPKPTRDASERPGIATERERRGSMIELGNGASSAKRDAEHVRAVTTGSPMMSREDRISQLLKEADMFEQASERSRAKTSGSVLPAISGAPSTSIAGANKAARRVAAPKQAFTEVSADSSTSTAPHSPPPDRHDSVPVDQVTLHGEPEASGSNSPVVPGGRNCVKFVQPVVRGHHANKGARSGFCALPAKLPFGMQQQKQQQSSVGVGVGLGGPPRTAETMLAHQKQNHPASLHVAASHPQPAARHSASHDSLPHVTGGLGGGMRGASRATSRHTTPNPMASFGGIPAQRRSMPSLTHPTLGGPPGSAHGGPMMGVGGRQRGGMGVGDPRTVMAGRKSTIPGITPPESGMLRVGGAL